jgi:brefeldin A-inhibited guanine nucleotide-exchange protein
MLNTCNLALCSIVDVFTYYYDELAPNFLSNIYQQFFLCVQHGNEELAKVAVECFENLVASNGSKFEKHMWEETVTLIVDIFESTTPDL